MTAAPSVLVELDQGVGVVTLNRSTRRNALDLAAWEALDDALRRLGDDPACRAVVLTGAGGSFCSGIDLADRLRRRGPNVVEHEQRRIDGYLRVIERIRDLPHPVIAAVNGPAVGAGFALACACDLRVAATGASFHAPFVTVGLSAGDLGLTWFLPRLIGAHRAAQLLLTGGTLSASEAIGAGLAVAADDAGAEAMSLARTIAAQPAYGVRSTKAMLAASLAAGGQHEHLRAELRTQLLCALTDAYQGVDDDADPPAGPHDRAGGWS